MPRGLIVNADDFGQTIGITRGIARAHERGLVTSASLMVSWPAAAVAAAYARNHPTLSVGLHVDLGEWMYTGREWMPLYERVDRADPDAVAREVKRQLEHCSDLLGRTPTHIDSHQHVHRKEPARSVVMRLAADLGLPLRHFTPAIHYCGEFYGQTVDGRPLGDRIDPAALVALLRRLPDGITELGCHPGYATDLNSMYASEREVELRTLCAPDVREALATLGIRLVSFREQEVA
jgi:predicted glycoside hydrolase/deacetylase ChbG (UPF0249 family)